MPENGSKGYKAARNEYLEHLEVSIDRHSESKASNDVVTGTWQKPGVKVDSNQDEKMKVEREIEKWEREYSEV